ncbi:MAG: flagellar biosynthesis switch protein [Bdellovibrio sp.]|nr:MAG: flagellar biosynthesis switch protein [Bdellovibrio sp.]
MRKARPTKSISLTSGKGGVGKTTLTCNLAYELARRGRRVLIFDGDLGLANVDLFFNVKPRGHILEVIQGKKSLADIMTPLLPGADLISGGSGVTEFNRITPSARRALVDAVSLFEYRYDYLLIDTAPGISDQVLFLNAAAQEILMVITPDASSLADSYALIKVLHQQFRENKFAVVCNQVRDEMEGFSLFQKFAEVAHRFLFLSLDYWGSVATDPLFRKSAAGQRLAMKHDHNINIRQTFEQLCDRIEKEAELSPQKSGLQFFWEQVVGVA